MFQDDAKSKFGVTQVASSGMNAAILDWLNTYRGNPPWLKVYADSNDPVKTIGFAKTVCSETARLVTLAIGINVSGGARGTWLQKQVDKSLYPRLRSWVEYGAACGTVIFKPNGHGIDVVTPDRFMVTECDSNHKITGIVFQDSYANGDDHFTKLEYHRFRKVVTAMPDGTGSTKRTVYQISTKTFFSKDAGTIGREIPITDTKWADIQPEVQIVKNNDDRIDSMLFGVFTMPMANSIDFDSPLGMSIFADAMQEMEDLDVGYSRNAEEIDNSNTIELLDDALIQMDGKKVKNSGRIHLPSHVKNVFGNGVETFYQQIDRPLKTDMRKIGINQLLSFIGFKCGYSDGYFVFDNQHQMATATQVEADDRRTIQLIKDIRDNLRSAMDDTIYAMSVFADLYDLAPAGTYKTDYSFGDITYNYEEDRTRWYQLMVQGVVPKWMYLVKFEGFSEDEAKAVVAETEQASEQQQLFSQIDQQQKAGQKEGNK